MTFSGRRYAACAAALATLAGVYFAGAGALHLAPAQGALASWWPALGLSVALIAMAPRSWWLPLSMGVVVASGAANATGDHEPGTAALFGLANAVAAALAGLILKGPDGGRPQLTSLDDFLRLARASVAGALVSATGIAATGVLLEGDSFMASWRTVFAGDAAAILVILPVAMSLRGGTAPRNRRWETALQSTALLGVMVGVFASDQTLPLGFAPLPLLVWAALRLDVRVVTWQLLGVSVLCTALTAEGQGPFAAAVASGASSVAAAGTMVQLWLLSASVMSLPLTVVIEQRRQLLSEVSAREELFRRNFTDSLTGMLLLRPRGDRLEIVDANAAAVRILGRTPVPLVGRYLDRVLSNPSVVRRQLAAVISGEQVGWHADIGLADRPESRVNIAVTMLTGGDAKVFSAQLLDVSVEHEARTRIEAAERLTSATLEATAGLVLMSTLDGRLVRVNPAACALTGFTEEELLGRPVWETITAPELMESVRARFASPGGQELLGSRETQVVRKDGERLHVVWNNNLVYDEHGDPAYVVLTGLDVTAERRSAGLVTHLLRAAITTALIGIDGCGRVTMINSGAQRMLGCRAEDVIGTPFLAMLDADEVAERTARSAEPGSFAALAAEVGPHGESKAKDWTWIAVDGTRHTISMTLSAASTGDGAVQPGYLCVGRDVTEQRHSQEMLIAALEKERTAVERLRKLDAAKNEFVSTVSHELRTPVTSIVGYTELLRDGSVVEPHSGQLPMLDTIARNGERLITICNDLLTLGGLDSGVTSWDRDRVDLSAMLEHVEDSIQPLVTGRTLEVRFEHPHGPTVVLGDRIQLERAVTNLIGNAVKFTEDGGAVGCRLERREDEAWLVVHDTGIGIPEDEQSGLFQKFFRSSTAQERAIPGTGLGLSIVAGIVASHGGRIGVSSAHLEGTTFTVRLPLHRN